jgi:hypothetical protein
MIGRTYKKENKFLDKISNAVYLRYDFFFGLEETPPPESALCGSR